jgi:hypothetical protein
MGAAKIKEIEWPRGRSTVDAIRAHELGADGFGHSMGVITMTRLLAVLSRLLATRTVQQYGPVVLSLAAGGTLSFVLRGYTYSRPLFPLALVLASGVAAWARVSLALD